jgi:hypothetical protein
MHPPKKGLHLVPPFQQSATARFPPLADKVGAGPAFPKSKQSDYDQRCEANDGSD